MPERKLGPSWVDSLGLLAVITVLLTISRKTEKSEWFLTWRGCFLGGSGKDRIKGLVRTRLCLMTLSELLSSFSFLQFLLWMLKFPHLAPFSVQGTCLLPCRGSRHRLLLSSLWTTGKPQLLQSELCTGFRSWSGAQAVTLPGLQFCPNVRPPRSATEGFCRDWRAGFYL